MRTTGDTVSNNMRCIYAQGNFFFFCSFQIRTRRGKQRKAHTNRLCIAISTYKSYQGIRYQGTYVFRADEVTGVRVGVCSVMV